VDVDRLLLDLARDMPAAKAAGEAAKMTGQAKQDLFRRLVELRDAKDG
jgi:16S rRNA (cytidine1402-2'-O)-methyltransferase